MTFDDPLELLTEKMLTEEGDEGMLLSPVLECKEQQNSDTGFDCINNEAELVADLNEQPKVRKSSYIVILPPSFSESEEPVRVHPDEYNVSEKAESYHRLCEVCGKEFYSKNAYSRHKKTCEISVLPSCGKCFEIFTTSFSLALHEPKCKGPLLYPRVCEFCSKSYSSKISFFKHKQLCHHYSYNFARREQEKLRQKCLSCSRIFCNKFSLKRHMKRGDSLSRLYPRTCKVCLKVYSNKCSYSKHKNNCQKVPKEISLPKKAKRRNNLTLLTTALSSPQLLNFRNDKANENDSRNENVVENNLSDEEINDEDSRNKSVKKSATKLNVQSSKVVKKYRKLIAHLGKCNEVITELTVQSDEVGNKHMQGMYITDSCVSTKIDNEAWEIVLKNPCRKCFTVVLKTDVCEVKDHCYYKCTNSSCRFLCSHMYTCSCPDSSGLCSHIHKVHSFKLKNRPFQFPTVQLSDEDLSNDSVTQSDVINDMQNVVEVVNDDIVDNTTLINSIKKSMDVIESLLPHEKSQHLLPAFADTIMTMRQKFEEACKEKQGVSILKKKPDLNLPKKNVRFDFISSFVKDKDMHNVFLDDTPVTFELTNIVDSKAVNTKQTNKNKNSNTNSFTYPLLNEMQLENVVTTINKTRIKVIDLKSLDYFIPESECVLIQSKVNGFRRGWLYDSIIDAYLYIVSRPHPNTVIIPTFVCAFLSNESIDLNTLLIHFTEYDFAEKSSILFPCITGDSHWILIVVNLLEQSVIILDPISEKFSSISQFMVSRVKEILRRKVKSVVNPVSWKIITPLTARQKDAHNCGVFICYFAFQFLNCQGLQEEFDPLLYRVVIYETITNYRFAIAYSGSSLGKSPK